MRCSQLFVAHIGDTIHRVGEIIEPMTGFQPTKAMVSVPGSKRDYSLSSISTGLRWSVPYRERRLPETGGIY